MFHPISKHRSFLTKFCGTSYKEYVLNTPNHRADHLNLPFSIVSVADPLLRSGSKF